MMGAFCCSQLLTMKKLIWTQTVNEQLAEQLQVGALVLVMRILAFIIYHEIKSMLPWRFPYTY